jgi:putative ATPase
MDDFFEEDAEDGESDRIGASAASLSEAANRPPDPTMPLAARMRPRNLDEYVGQSHILAEGKLLRRAIEADRFTSLIFYGPPGVGKTSLAELIAQRTDSRFINLSGVESNVAEIRRAVEAARQFQRTRNEITTLFVDEIHRFNKSQQDVLLPHIERGTVRFIGATTHNPYFYVNSPLVSRSQVFQLEPLTEQDLATLLQAAVKDPERGFGKKPLILDEDAASHLVRMCDGDARKLLTSFELAVLTTEPDPETGDIHVDLAVAEDSIQRKTVVYDADGDAHYDTISAFIKSMRGCDPDATLYWLAKMLYAGEDIRFIARRIVISASEDIGMADSNALRVAVAAQQAVEFIGMPEARVPLAHAAVYMATAPKSNRTYVGINAALEDVKNGRTLAVPPHLRTKSRKKLGTEGGAIAEGETTYLYGHDYEDGYVPQAYLPEGRVYYEPSSNGLEQRVAERLDHWRKQFESKSGNSGADTGEGPAGSSASSS